MQGVTNRRALAARCILAEIVMQVLQNKQCAFTLTELVAVVAILGVLAVLIVPRLSGHLATSKSAACQANKADIELQVKLWRRNHGSYPPGNLGTIGTDPTYFPSGLPTCPITGAAYTIDTTTGLVTGHSH